MLEREVKSGQVYRHFKGHIYEIMCIAKDSESLCDMVIYKNKENNDIWCRSIDMFLSEVDHDKYPDVLQKYRFELIEK